MNASFYNATNIAQQVVALSLTNPSAEWSMVCVGLGGTRFPNGYRFADGSAVTFTASGLPVEYIGG